MLKCVIFADFLDFENGCCYLNTIARKKRKNTLVSCIFAYVHTLLYWFKYIIFLHEDGHGRKIMLKCAILKTVAATLTQLHAREKKHMGFLHFA